jgi:hypothetical protein
MDYKLECASVFVYSTLFRCSCSLGLDLEFEFVKECYMSIQMEAGVGSSICMFRFFCLDKRSLNKNHKRTNRNAPIVVLLLITSFTW